MPLLYALTDEHVLPRERLLESIEEALRSGVGMLQLREKKSGGPERLDFGTKLKALCDRYNVPLIVNDDIELARALGARGVHLGKDDATIEEARDLLGESAIIGVSCYNSIARAYDAAGRGASYVAFGSLFGSPTKPEAPRVALETLREAKKKLSVDVCAIGGITPENVREVKDVADIVAVSSALWSAPDIRATVKKFLDHFETIKT